MPGSERTSPGDSEPQHPKGALFLMVIFLLLLVGTWLYTYSILLGRG